MMVDILQSNLYGYINQPISFELQYVIFKLYYK